MLVWRNFQRTAILFDFPGSMISLARIMGIRRFEPGDDRRDSRLLALATLCEAWHNNHHHYMHSTRQGFYWWEIDITYYGLKVLESVGLIWDLNPVTAKAYSENSE